MRMMEAVRAHGAPAVEVHGQWVVVAAVDRPGLMGRIAGAVALSGCEVTEAVVQTTDGVALDRLRVLPGRGGLDSTRIRTMVIDALSGRLALSWRLAERHRSYHLTRSAAPMLPVEVRVLNDVSESSTVIEVLGPDSVGLLYRLASALEELDVDIAQARVSTLGDDVVDSFYVRSGDGGKVEDEHRIAEIRAALLHALGPLA
jgi:[protein-PII] uridylyltransferase